MTFAIVWFNGGHCFQVASILARPKSGTQRAARWGSTSTQEGQQQKFVVTKASLYVSAYAIVWTQIVVTMILRRFENVHEANLVTSIFLRLQGCLNFLIYSKILQNTQ